MSISLVVTALCSFETKNHIVKTLKSLFDLMNRNYIGGVHKKESLENESLTSYPPIV